MELRRLRVKVRDVQQFGVGIETLDFGVAINAQRIVQTRQAQRCVVFFVARTTTRVGELGHRMMNRIGVCRRFSMARYASIVLNHHEGFHVAGVAIVANKLVYVRKLSGTP